MSEQINQNQGSEQSDTNLDNITPEERAKRKADIEERVDNIFLSDEELARRTAQKALRQAREEKIGKQIDAIFSEDHATYEQYRLENLRENAINILLSNGISQGDIDKIIK